MPNGIAEKDWKTFKDLHPIVLERFFQKVLAEIRHIVLEKDKDGREQFWAAFELMNERRKEAARLFDDFRRSTAIFQLAMMCVQGLLTDEEMGRFSVEAREAVERLRGIKAGPGEGR
jgi:hypothetical protein